MQLPKKLLGSSQQDYQTYITKGLIGMSQPGTRRPQAPAVEAPGVVALLPLDIKNFYKLL
jgi:hypothetical protein